MSAVLVSVFFSAGADVLFWYWCVHAAGVYYEYGAHTRTPPPGVCILVLECAFFFVVSAFFLFVRECIFCACAGRFWAWLGRVLG